MEWTQLYNSYQNKSDFKFSDKVTKFSNKCEVVSLMRKLFNLAMKTQLYLPQNRKETNRIIRIHRKDKKQNNRLNNVRLVLQRLTLIFIWLKVRCPNSQLLLDFGLLSFQPLYFTIPTFTFKHNGTICLWIVQSVFELKFS